MADLHAWRNAATELPPEGVPVLGVLDDDTSWTYELARDDDGNVVWAQSEVVTWVREREVWASASAWYDDDYTVRYWHPLPTVPTLAELDAAGGGES